MRMEEVWRMVSCILKSAFIFNELCYIILSLAMIRQRYHCYNSSFDSGTKVAEEIKGRVLFLE